MRARNIFIVLLLILITAGYFYLLRDRQPLWEALGIASIAGTGWLILFLGIIDFREKRDHLRLVQRDGFNPVDNQRITVSGTIHARGSLLSAPGSGHPCVAYRYLIRPSKGRRHGLLDGMASVPCEVHSSAGNFRILGYPYIRELGAMPYRDAQSMERFANYFRSTVFTPFDYKEDEQLEKRIFDDQTAYKRDYYLRDPNQVPLGWVFEYHLLEGESVVAVGTYSASRSGIVPPLEIQKKTKEQLLFFLKVKQLFIIASIIFFFGLAQVIYCLLGFGLF